MSEECIDCKENPNYRLTENGETKETFCKIHFVEYVKELIKRKNNGIIGEFV